MKNLKFRIILFTFLNAVVIVNFAQHPAVRESKYILSTDSFTVTAGPRFAASTAKQFWWGKHWRDEWLEPINFPVFNMDTTAGGLTPLKRGGGHETKTLRLIGRNGKEYVLRTVDKSLDALIPDELKGSFLNDIANDQISTAHPYGPLVIARLSAAIGILHTNPVFVYVSYEPGLGEFNEDFAYKLCLFEERASGDGWENTALTGFAQEVINSERLFERLTASNKRQVDQKEFLKVRLLDMLVNDWDRHDDQWVWASKQENGETVYRPFARDRDQAFSKTEGVNLFLLSRPWAFRSLQNLDARIHDVIGTNLAATSLDKQFMNALTEEDWRQTIIAMQQQISDSVIRSAIQSMPDPIRALSGDFLYRRLTARRNDMIRFGMRYYEILNKEVFIIGTDQREVFTMFKTDNHTTEIVVKRVNEKGLPEDTFYHRAFDHNTTKEINIYGMGNNDQFVYAGDTKNSILIRVMGGKGQDSYADITSKKNRGKKIRIYDSPPDKIVISNAFRYRSTTDILFTDYQRKGFQYDWWLPLIIPGYNPDDGFVIGAGLLYKKRQWNKMPYAWQQTIGASYAAATGAYSLYYKGIFKKVFRKWDVELAANYNAPGYVVNFYGFGNGTELITRDKNFYRVRATSVFFNPAISRSWKNNVFKTGLIFNTVRVKPEENKFIGHGIPSIDSSVFRTKYFSGVNLSYIFSSANNTKYSTKGIRYEAGSYYWINLKEGRRDFVNLKSDFTFYYTFLKSITIAHRTGVAINKGDYEFYQANTIGGSENLRGYWRARFTGRTIFYQNTDIRVKLADLRGYFLRGNLGVYGFFDDGRVWTREGHSNTLHYGYGGGIYFIPFNTLAINLSYASSKEVNVFTFRTGFLF